ncbi:hypothetical protein FQZ97_858450 [compost metagenome]
MHRQGDGRFSDPLRGGALPVDALVQADVQAGGTHARVRMAGENIERPVVETGGQQVEVRFALQAQLLPGTPVIAAPDQAKGVGQAAALGRMTTAVDRPARHGIAHVVVRRPGGLAPVPRAVDGQPLVAGNGQLLTVRAESQAVHMHQGDRRVTAGAEQGDGGQ